MGDAVLTLAPVQLQGVWALPLPALASVGLESTRRRFLSSHDAVAWFLTAPWSQAESTRP